MAKILVVLNGVMAMGESDKSVSEILAEEVFTLENAQVGDQNLELLFVRSASVSGIGIIDDAFQDDVGMVSVIQDRSRNPG